MSVAKFLKENPDYVKKYYKNKKDSKSLPTTLDYLDEYTINDLKDEIRYLRDKLDEKGISYERPNISGNKTELKRKVRYLESVAEQHGGENIAKSILKTVGKGIKSDLKTKAKGARKSHKGSHTRIYVSPAMQPKYQRVLDACKRAGYGAMVPSHRRKGWDADCPFTQDFMENPRRYKLPKEYR